MVFTLFLFTVFIASLGILWYRVSLKLPQLVLIPDWVITERLHRESARLNLFLIHFKSFLKEKRHWDFFWNFAAKAVYRTHLFLLRIDNAALVFLRKIREEGRVVNMNAEYWKQLGRQTPENGEERKNERIEEIHPKQ